MTDDHSKVGEQRAYELGNRGPIEFDVNGMLREEMTEAYWRTGFYVFEGVVQGEELDELIAEFEHLLTRAPTSSTASTDAAGRPACKATEILAAIDDPRFVTELARFNLEANLSPLPFEGDCLSRMHAELDECIQIVRDCARPLGANVLLTGILPTLQLSDLSLDSMAPNPRYHALNKAVRAIHGGDFDFRIKGVDELQLTHDNVMLEAANTSFQIHFQVGAPVFARMYNLAQAVAAPVLAAAVNSPI